ncbi:hypothetical protein KO465_10505, partial [Candidatus Micrarchaeota archaeon]|nr:hypothetical protein [Candidatus Micrarchaeota archaeon]
MRNKLKAQSAMEYLQTYGWALLIIIVVLAIILYIMGFLGTPEYCLFDDISMSCMDPSVPGMSQDAYILGKLTNNHNKDIIVRGTLCVEQPPLPLSFNDTRTFYFGDGSREQGRRLRQGQGFLFNDLGLQCHKGNYIVNLTQSRYNGHLYIWY